MFACSFKVVAQLIVSFYCEFLVAPVGLLPFPAQRTKDTNKVSSVRSAAKSIYLRDITLIVPNIHKSKAIKRTSS